MTTDRRRRAWWYVPTVGVWASLTVVAVMLVLGGDWSAGAAVFMVAGLYVLQRVHARAMYRLGWRAGFAESAAAPGEVHAGRVPAFALRAQMRRGDPVPEPWDGVPSPDVEAAFVTRPGDDSNPAPGA